MQQNRGLKDYDTKRSKSDKDKYHIILLICRILKMIQMNLFTKQKSFTDLENEFMVTGGGSEREEINWEFGTDMYIVLYLE